MEIRHLRYFIAVAEELNFRRAAKRLNISQPPLSLQIQQLEQEIGSRLLDRSQQRVSLTATGRVFLDHARHILQEISAAKTAVSLVETGGGGELRIGFTQSSEFQHFLSATIRRFRDDHPLVELTLREMSSLDQLEAIERRALDFGICRMPRGRIDRHVALREICSDPLVAVVPSGSPFAGRARIDIADLRNERFVCLPQNSGTGLRQLFAGLCWDQGFSPIVVQEARELSTVIALVAAGLGVAIVPATMRCIQTAGVRYVDLGDASAHASLYLMHNEEEMSPLKTRFIAILLAEIETDESAPAQSISA